MDEAERADERGRRRRRLHIAMVEERRNFDTNFATYADDSFERQRELANFSGRLKCGERAKKKTTIKPNHRYYETNTNERKKKEENNEKEKSEKAKETRPTEYRNR